MIKIQLKSGEVHITNSIKFIVLSNIEHIDFWITNEKGGNTRINVAVSKIEGISTDNAALMEIVATAVVETYAEVAAKLGVIHDKVSDILTLSTLPEPIKSEG
jgi:hypothetical protein